MGDNIINDFVLLNTLIMCTITLIIAIRIMIQILRAVQKGEIFSLNAENRLLFMFGIFFMLPTKILKSIMFIIFTTAATSYILKQIPNEKES